MTVSFAFNRYRGVRQIVLMAIATGSCWCVDGCAVDGTSAGASSWRRGTVVKILRIRDVGDVTDVCVAPPANRDQHEGGLKVIVRSRVGKSSRDEAFVLPLSSGIQVGAAVRVLSATCAVDEVSASVG